MMIQIMKRLKKKLLMKIHLFQKTMKIKFQLQLQLQLEEHQ